MNKQDLLESDRNAERVWLTESDRDKAERLAHERHEKNGNDANTRCPDNIIVNRTRGAAGERAFYRWACHTFGQRNVYWQDIDGDGDKEPCDFVVNGVNVDIQTRNDAADYDKYAILKEKNLVQKKRNSGDVDVYVCMVSDDRAREHVIWGYVEADRLHDPQAIAGPWYGFDQPMHYLDDKSPYFKCVAELKRRLSDY